MSGSAAQIHATVRDGNDGGVPYIDRVDPRSSLLVRQAGNGHCHVANPLAFCDSADAEALHSALVLWLGADSGSGGGFSEEGGISSTDRDSEKTRLLRRASLAIRGSLPTLSEYRALLEGQKTYAEYVREFKSSEGFVERMTKLYLRPFLNRFIPNSRFLQASGVGTGPVFRRINRPFVYSGRFGGHSPFSDLDCDTDNCVLENPMKANYAHRRRHELARTTYFPWGLDPNPFYYNYTAVEGGSVVWNFGQTFYFGKSGSAGLAGVASIQVPFGRISGEAIASSVDAGSPMLQDGFYAGCIVPDGDDPARLVLPQMRWPTTNGQPGGSFVNPVPYPSPRPMEYTGGTPNTLQDSLGVFMANPSALRAVRINPWWAPERQIWACPGLAVDVAVAQGVIPAADPRASTTYLAGGNYRLHGATYGCTSSAADTAHNMACDCGPNLERCNPLHEAVQMSVNYEAMALFRHVVSGERPYREFLSGDYRMTNRALEWMQLARLDEGEKIRINALEPRLAPGEAGGQWWLNRSLNFSRLPMLPRMSGLPTLPERAWVNDTTVPLTGTAANNRNRLAASVGNYQTFRYVEPQEDVLSLFASRPGSESLHPVAGVLSTSTFLSTFPKNRTRVSEAHQFFQCGAVGSAGPLGVESFEEQSLPPRYRVNGGCAGCHVRMDALSSFFMGFWAEDNSNLGNDGTLAGDGRVSLLLDGQPYTSPFLIRARASAWGEPTASRHYGTDQNPFGPSQIDQHQGRLATEELQGVAHFLGQEPGFTRCSLTRVWEVLLGRRPRDMDQADFDRLVERFRGTDYSLSDLAEAIAHTPAFRGGVR